MKKFLALTLCALLAGSAILTGCAGKTKTVKFGAGVYNSGASAVDATEDKNGTGKIDVTVAAVTVDADGKIASCELDTISYSVGFTNDGKAVSGDFKTKYELGKDYNMVAYGKAVKEWFEQADTFETLVAGKTLDEIKALVAEGNKGTDEVTTAGCTIMINEFVAAIEKAYNAATVEISADAALDVSVATEQSLTDATEEKDGTNKVECYVFASALDKDGKTVAASSDCVEAAFTFNAEGASTLDTSKAVLSKKEKGDSYGMVAYGGAKLEWYEQAAAFDATCIGKTKAEIAGIVDKDGKGNDELQTAGCTIVATGLVKAASK